jgi:hypothetical protein
VGACINYRVSATNGARCNLSANGDNGWVKAYPQRDDRGSASPTFMTLHLAGNTNAPDSFTYNTPKPAPVHLSGVVGGEAGNLVISINDPDGHPYSFMDIDSFTLTHVGTAGKITLTANISMATVAGGTGASWIDNGTDGGQAQVGYTSSSVPNIRQLIKTDLSGLPRGLAVTSAVLRLYMYVPNTSWSDTGTNQVTCELYRGYVDWSFTNTCFNYRLVSSSTPWPMVSTFCNERFATDTAYRPQLDIGFYVLPRGTAVLVR